MTKKTFNPCPKRKPYRDPHLLRMAMGREPIAQLHDVLSVYEINKIYCDTSYDHCETTVAAHPNGLIYGKGGASKAHDFLIIFLGWKAHNWLDQVGASINIKTRFYWMALERQFALYRVIANNPLEPKKDRESVRNALGGFRGWVTDNKRVFKAGDWQLSYLKECLNV